MSARSSGFQAVFVAAFSNDDPGLSSIANNFFSLDSDIVNSTIGFPKEINGYVQFGSMLPSLLSCFLLQDEHRSIRAHHPQIFRHCGCGLPQSMWD